MKKKEYVYIVILIISTIVVMVGIFSLLDNKYDVKEAKKIQNIENIYNENIIRTAMQEEKVSPNADFALKKHYDECNHFDYKEAELPQELVNLTKQEVEDYYDDWEVEEFNSKHVVLCKEVNGYCDQHFLIKLNNEKVVVYRLGSLGELAEYKKTDISKDYLPEEDIEKLKKGIPVYGEGKISSILEDYE